MANSKPTMKNRRHRRTRTWVGVVPLVVSISWLSGCSDDTPPPPPPPPSSAAPATTEAAGRNFAIDTADGQASISMTGQLPPNWPSDFPVPENASPAGSGSIGGKERTFLVGVFQSPDSAEESFDYYRNNQSLSTGNQAVIGRGPSYVASIQVTSPENGRVTVTRRDGGSLLVIALARVEAASTVPPPAV